MTNNNKADKILQIGTKAPAIKLLSDKDKLIQLKDIQAESIVLFFYPKDMTSGCTQEACDFRDRIAEFKKLKVVVIGISKDSVESHQKFKEKYKLPFDLLSDPESKVCESFGVWKEKSMYGRKYMGIERTTFILDSNKKIKKIFLKVKVKGHVEEVLEALKEK